MLTRLWNVPTTAVAAFAFLFYTADLRPEGDKQDSVELLPHWKKGDKLRFEVVKTRVDSKEKKVTSNVTVRTQLEIEVLKASKDGFTLRRTTGESKFDDPKLAENPVLLRMTNLLKGISIVLEIDSQGIITGVQNWKEIKETSSKLIDAMIEEMQKAGFDKATVAQVRGQAASMYSTKEKVEQICTPEAQLFVAAPEKRISHLNPIESEDKLPNLLGGESIPSRAVYSLKGVDRKSGLTVISFKQTLDPKAAKRVIEKTIRDLAARIGKPLPNEDLLKTMSIEDAAEFSIDLTSGWTRRLTHTRTVTIGAQLGVTTTTIARKVE